jgi:membrane-associated phospholipid phosphatase
MIGYSRARNRSRRALVAACWIMVAPALLAQATSSAPRSAVVFTGRDLALIGGATLGTAAVSLFDVRIARSFGDSTFHARHSLVEITAKRTSAVTETALMVTTGSVWAIARLGHADGTADVALHTFESVAGAAMFIQVIRGVLGRARPYVIDDAGEKRDGDPYEFQLFHGFTSFNYRSFPSMHAMASFAAATALSQEMRQRKTRYRGVMSPVLYVAASASPLARMYLDEHWTSDVVLGAFLGIFSGQKVVTYSHEHPNNPIDRRFLKPEMRLMVARSAKGFSLSLLPF